jgi:hypothetical protein
MAAREESGSEDKSVMAGSCWNAGGGVADVRRLAVNGEVLKGVLQMATKRLQMSDRFRGEGACCRRAFVGAGEACDLLIFWSFGLLIFRLEIQSVLEKIAASLHSAAPTQLLRSVYTAPTGAVRWGHGLTAFVSIKRNAPNQSGHFFEDAASGKAV